MNDLEITRLKELEHIRDVAARYEIPESELMLYGESKAKVKLSLLDRLQDRPDGRYVVVTAITPTPLGEGKTVNTVGLSLGLDKIGKKAVCTIRQPSMGPVFGIKGGAAGGGYSQVVPSEDFNLHLTGDFHAISSAHNLCAAFADTSLLLDNPHDLSAERLTFRRVVDMNDRALREIEVGLGGDKNGVPRRTGFDITSASEIMAIMGLSEGYVDLKRRLERIVVGTNSEGDTVTAKDLRCSGAMAALLKDSIMPTIMQTLEGTLSFIHTGPFANIAHGNSSIIADRMALKVADYVVTEAGFGADMGCEKFFNIKCRASGLTPDCAVMVATVRGIKFNSGRYRVVPGKPLPEEMLAENLDDLEHGIVNLAAQIENVRMHGVPVVVAVNRFPGDHESEIQFLVDKAKLLGASDAVVSECHARGGDGATELAKAVETACESGETNFHLLYPDEATLEEKILTLALRVYGAARVDYSKGVRTKLQEFERLGYGRFPICMAKTQYSLSHDPKLKGRPHDFAFPIVDVRVAAGAGFVYPLAGTIMTMPGLGRHPGGMGIDLDDQGQINGLF